MYYGQVVFKFIRKITDLFHRLSFSIFAFLFVLSLSSFSIAAPISLTYQGRILKADGTPLEYSNVSFIFQITDPSGQCVIYQEQISSINMTNSSGVFDVPIGTATIQYPLGGTATVLDVFNNSGSYTCGSCSSTNGVYTCANGSSTYTATANDIRKLRVSFYDGSGWRLITPDNTIRSVPFAAYSLSAQKLGTNSANDFLLKAGLPTCGAGTFLTWSGSALTCGAVSGSSGGTVTAVTSSNSYLSVATGTSTPALTVNVGTIAGTVAAGDDSRITGAFQTSSSLGGDLTGTLPNPAVSKINGVSVSSAVAGDDGKFLKFVNGSGWQPHFVKLSELKNATGAASAFNVGSCTAAQTLVWSSITDQFSCQDITLPASKVTGLATVATSGAYSDLAGTPTLNTLLPAQTGQNGKFLTTDGTNTSWAASSSQWTTSGSNLYYNTGNVGIGTTSPAYPLQVAGTTRINDVGIGMGSDQIGNVTGNTLFINYNLGNVAMVQGSGKVGVGIYTAGSKLSVQGNMSVGATYAALAGPTSGAIFEGNVGIGTTTPTEKLEVNGGVKLGTTVGTNAGTIRWDGTHFQGYNGADWVNFVPNPASSGACDTTNTYSVAGTYSYTVPASFGTITIQIWGGGGGGGAAYSGGATAGGTGGTTSIVSLGLTALGGAGGGAGNGAYGTGGAGGVASGGDTNSNGGAGGTAASLTSGAGGNAPNGGVGGASRGQNSSGASGTAPGGGGSGGGTSGISYAGGGGSGGYILKSYTTATLSPGTIISGIVVGAGGAAGTGPTGTQVGGVAVSAVLL